MKGKNSHNWIFGELSSPYQKNKTDTMAYFFERWRLDNNRIIIADDRTYYRIISKENISVGERTDVIMVFMPSSFRCKLHEKLIDEDDNEFIVSETPFFSYVHPYKEWMIKTFPIILQGDANKIGEYLYNPCQPDYAQHIY